MSVYAIEFTSAAKRQILALSKTVRRRLAPAIEGLRENPRPSGCKKLKGASDLFRIRVGDFRVVYEVRDQHLVVLVVRVGDRKDVYEGR